MVHLRLLRGCRAAQDAGIKMKKIMFNDKYGLTEAVLKGRKTMTRRIVPGKLVKAIEGGMPGYAVMESKYEVGEVVAVAQSYMDAGYDRDMIQRATFRTNAYGGKQIGDFEICLLPGWKNKMYVFPSMMPHQIRITNVRVERLQDISDEDCLREGIEKDGGVYSFNDYEGYKTPRNAFAELIDRVSGKGTWLYNPLVFVYEFELVR